MNFLIPASREFFFLSRNPAITRLYFHVIHILWVFQVWGHLNGRFKYCEPQRAVGMRNMAIFVNKIELKKNDGERVRRITTRNIGPSWSNYPTRCPRNKRLYPVNIFIRWDRLLVYPVTALTTRNWRTAELEEESSSSILNSWDFIFIAEDCLAVTRNSVRNNQPIPWFRGIAKKHSVAPL